MDPLANITTWFTSRGWSPFEFQLEAWRAYLAHRSGLIHAPTGMGKTYAAWLGPLAESLADAAADRESPEPLRVLWLTPLRALATDTAHALAEPLAELGLTNWSVQARTGDTSYSKKAKQRSRLPACIITTPESLSILLSYPGNAERFASLRCIVCDEWHELLSTKRGTQAELCLARLRTLAPQARTWGLSATIANIDEAAHALTGIAQGVPRPACRPWVPIASAQEYLAHPPSPLISSPAAGGGGAERSEAEGVHNTRREAAHPLPPLLIRGIHHTKPIIIESLLPQTIERFPWAGHIGTALAPQVAQRIRAARSTLLFTNTRFQAEHWFRTLLRIAPDLVGAIALHHGSIDKELRQRIESMLRSPEEHRHALRAVVCTSSLDLGVDFSPVDQVIQIGSPKGVARLLQRAGRSGHQPGKTSTILCVPTHALELVEFAAARDEVTAGRVEPRHPRHKPLDTLTQHMVTIALGDGFDERQLLDEVRSTAAFADLSDFEWSWALDFAGRGGAALANYPDHHRIERSAETGLFHVPHRRAAVLHRMSIGTITADQAVVVKYSNGRNIGTIEESFISRLNPGQRFVLAGRVLELVRLRDMQATVVRARSSRGIVPRWMGGKMPLSSRLADATLNRLDLAHRGVLDTLEMRALEPLLRTQEILSILPRPGHLVVECIETDEGHHAFLFPFAGRLAHEALGAILAHRITSDSERTIRSTANDFGIELAGELPFDLDAARWRAVMSPEGILEDALRAINASELARRAFREVARIAGLIHQGFPGTPIRAKHLQASSDLFYDVFREFDPDNLLLTQAEREAAEGQLDIPRLRGVLERLGSWEFHVERPATITPLAFPLYAESMRTTTISSETWEARVRRAAELLAAAAPERAA